MKSLPNYISVSRVILAIFMGLMEPLSVMFYMFYFLCGISDILDGYIARKTNTTSEVGDKLDSIADFVMVTILVVVLYPMVNLKVQVVLWVAGIGIIRVVSIIIVLIKYRTFEIMHTYGNKITGGVLFLLPFSISLNQSENFIYFICGIATVSAIEELLIHLCSRELNIDRKSIFMKNRQI